MARKLVLVGAVLMVIGIVIASRPLTRGDTYCGQPLWDTVDGPICDMAPRRAAAVVAFGGGAALVIVGARSTLVAIALVAATVAGLVCANRLLEPVDAAFCGSVVNRHTTNALDPTREDECDELLEPHRNQALAAGVVAAGLLGLGALADKLRQPEPI